MSMSRDQMVRYLDDPSTLNERTLGELREIIDEFPYFHTAHLLYIRNLQLENNFRFSGQLKLASAHVTDRTVLYHLLNSGSHKGYQTDADFLRLKASSDSSEQVSIELTDNVLNSGSVLFDVSKHASSQNVTDNFDLLNFDVSENTYSLDNINVENEALPSESSDLTNPLSSARRKGKGSDQKDHLIDRFIKDNPAFTVKQVENYEVIGKKRADLENISEKEEFITETLARIYMNQGLFQKAINAFEKLSLKYPEKSAYFARQIEEVTNLINK